MEPQTKVVKFSAIGKYKGHNIRDNKAIDLTMVFMYSELPDYIRLIQLLNENVFIGVKLGDAKPFKLGSFMIKSLNIDHDGQGTIKFNSMLDYVEADNINTIVGEEQIKVLFKAEIESEDEEEEDEDEDEDEDAE